MQVQVNMKTRKGKCMCSTLFVWLLVIGCVEYEKVSQCLTLGKCIGLLRI